MIKQDLSIRLSPDRTPENDPAAGTRTLSTALAELAARRTAAAVADMIWRYDLGVTVLALRPPAAHQVSRPVIERVVKALGMDPNTLRRYARVAATIAPDEFKRYVTLRSPSGLPLTWSHVERIAAAHTAELREHHARDACSQQLSVQELTRRIRDQEAACARELRLPSPIRRNGLPSPKNRPVM
jgi:hypothetical protein